MTRDTPSLNFLPKNQPEALK